MLHLCLRSSVKSRRLFPICPVKTQPRTGGRTSAGRICLNWGQPCWRYPLATEVSECTSISQLLYKSGKSIRQCVYGWLRGRVRTHHTFLLVTSPGLITLGLQFRNNVTHCEEEQRCKVKQSPQPVPEFNWKEFWKFLRPEFATLIWAILFACGAALLNTQIPLLLGDLMNGLVQCLQTNPACYLKAMKMPAIKLMIAYTLQGILTCCYITLLSRIGERVAANLRKELFSTLLRQDIAFFDATRTGQMVSRLTNDIQEFKSSFKLVISQGLKSVTQTIGCLVSLYLVSPKLTSLMCLVMPFLVGTGAYIGSYLRKLSQKAQEQIAKATCLADEALGNIRTVKAFAMEDLEINFFSQEVDEASSMSQILGFGIGIFQGLSNFSLNCVVLGTICVSGMMLAKEQLRAGDLMSFLVATQTVQRSLANISITLGQVIRGISSGSRVFEFLTLQSNIPIQGGFQIPSHVLVGQVQFDNIDFSYPTRPGQVVLHNFNLTLPASKMVAIVGQSGTGKSTIASLLERFYDPDSGIITLDGYDIRTLDPQWLRSHVIGYISQEPVLFGTSIKENIRFGKPDASDEEVYEAARQANADGFIQSFPDGYMTIVGERGMSLSGGQRQRIAIARALIKNPCILVLDEATSALDAESEKMVQDALDHIQKGRTVLVIAHRLSSIKAADVICVLANGCMKEVGTHAELMKRGGLYAELVRRQTSEETIM
ncbi:mitochondrial potassium channel ATP-binding subunit isoform X1 [Chiloscyllium plagiosum]|uniref:mitochondrial potassium channel ATP-binding subunit isoform X1 n=1 Tax=Chiloscyllium plagiosum TaxID=36176 RepID=UPI001CB7D949|nr:mitochondrial potassium channel ATP-binding subunit isoform X1 [Chiloscyllium plagiosum]